jgi:hypothetical protein
VTDFEVEELLEKKVMSERKITNQILELINLAEDRQIYLKRGYGSILKWLVERYKYSEGSANRRIAAAKILRGAPEVKAKLQDGSLSLSNIVKVRTATRRGADPREALAAVENKTMDQADQILAEMTPDLPRVEQKWVGKTTTQYLLSFRNETVAKLEQIRDFRSHIQHEANIADVIEHLTHRFFAEAKRSVIIERAGYCEFVDESTGRRCTSTYQLQEDHIVPLALGGLDHPSNMRCLCRRHNLLEAERKLGFRWTPHPLSC